MSRHSFLLSCLSLLALLGLVRGETVLIYLEPDPRSVALATISVGSEAYERAEEAEGHPGWFKTPYQGYFGGFIRQEAVRPDGSVSSGETVFLTPSEGGRVLTVTEPGDEIIINLPGRWTEITIRKTIDGYFRKQPEPEGRRAPIDLAAILGPSPDPGAEERMAPVAEERPVERPLRPEEPAPPVEAEAEEELDEPAADPAPGDRSPLTTLPALTPEERPDRIALPDQPYQEAETDALDPDVIEDLPEEVVEEELESAAEEEAPTQPEQPQEEVRDAEILPSDPLEVPLEEAELRGIEQPALPRQRHIQPATEIGRTLQGRLVRTRGVFRSPPYPFELRDSRGNRLAFVDASNAVVHDISRLIGRVVTVYGPLDTSAQRNVRVIRAANIYTAR